MKTHLKWILLILLSALIFLGIVVTKQEIAINKGSSLSGTETDTIEVTTDYYKNEKSDVVESPTEWNPWDGVSTTTMNNGMIKLVHKKWGISFQYPSVCEATFGEMMGEFGLFGDDNCNFSVLEYDLEDYGYLSTMTGIFPKKVEDILESDLENTELTEFHGFKAVKGIFYNEYINFRAVMLYVEVNEKIFEISYTISNEEKSFSQEMTQKILNSIIFIE
ncbi:MAG: hypothetical protein WAW13_03375 [Minisyncoccia bacterium]